MDSYSHSSSSSSSYNFSLHEEQKGTGKPPAAAAAYRSALHSVRKIPGKNIIMKKPIAPMPPTRPKVYKVDPVNFKDVVQKLTGAREFHPTRLQEVAPPPLSLSPPHRPKFSGGFAAEAEEEKPRKSFEITNFGGLSPLGFSLSPSSVAWCSSILLSPGTLSSLEPNAVL
ncbi:hypothetical protein CDL12_10420 [Handroanthus impetiginosus]|uniref:VQ domain-containing protein n=1 Tax=Handroanthus impetiginosus TaxID=429701 RepID=A0A2G9HHB6_9LAMI|nr:hypothetical protein CDL12_10420 [Handroanthus impetiginosus]